MSARARSASGSEEGHPAGLPAGLADERTPGASAVLAGLLAEPARLRVLGALALGATTPAEVVRLTGLDPREARAALRRLESGGLVGVEKGELRLHGERFKEAARAEAPPRPADEQLSSDPATAAVLRAFLRGGRITGFPVARGKRRLLLEHVASTFEPGVRYPEREVNALLRAWHEDYAMLRRFLVDEQLLDRENGMYWRIGGWVDTVAPPEQPPPSRVQRVAAYGLAERDGTVLLTHLARGEARGRWTLPGGGLGFGERTADAVVREIREEAGLEVRVDELLDADAELVRSEADGEPVLAHPVRILYRVTVLGGTLGVVEVDGSTDDAAWFPPGDLADAELTPVAARVLRTGRLGG